MTDAFLIGIAGPSCSGKTELARLLSGHLNAPILSLDHYYIDLSHLPLAERACYNFDHPDSLDRQLLVSQVAALRQGRPVLVPRYDFALYTRAEGCDPFPSAPVILVEGLFALAWPELRELLDLAVFIDAPLEVCLERRLARDVAERGRTPDSVRRQFAETVQPMAAEFVLPTRIHADLDLDGAQPPEVSAGIALACLRPALRLA